MRLLTERIDDDFEVYLSELKKLIHIRSVQENSDEDAPFGPGAKQALDQILRTASNWGFVTSHIDHAIGFAEWKNDTKSEDYIGILGHVDVVEEGTGWDYPPFELTIDQGKAYGRGVLDNKGPTLASLFALKLLKDEKKMSDKNIRVIFGTNEESGSKDLPYYLSKYSPPMYGFTPDSQFPAVYGEKGVISLQFKLFCKKNAGINRIVGPFVPSSVPDRATVYFSDHSGCETFHGLRAPSNEPQLGHNAITLLADSLEHNTTISNEAKDFFRFISKRFHNKLFGEGFIPEGSISSWGIQTTPYSLSYENNTFTFDVSIRYAIEKNKEDLLNYIYTILPENVTFDVTRYFPPIKFDRNHFMVNIMRDVYEEATGLDGVPIITTGATYARFMPNIIAFGPSFPGQIGIAHNKNEYMSIRDLKKNIEIYYRLLERLL